VANKDTHAKVIEIFKYQNINERLMQDGAKKIAKEKVKVIKKLNSKDSNIKRTLAVSNEYKPDHPSRKIGGL